MQVHASGSGPPRTAQSSDHDGARAAEEQGAGPCTLGSSSTATFREICRLVTRTALAGIWRTARAAEADFDEQIVLLRALSGDVSKPTIAEQERVLRRALREAGFAPTITEAPSKLLDRLPPRMRLYVALGIAVLLLLSLGSWFGRSGQQRRPPAPMLVPPAPVSSQPLPAARLTSAKRVKLQGTPAAAGSVLLAGAPVEVAAGGMGEFRLDRGGRVRVLSRSLALFSARGESR